MNILSILSGWKVKLVILSIALISLFAWHKVLVREAVTEATNELKLEYAQQVFRQVEIAKDESIKLKQEKEKADAEYKKNLANANARYRKLSDWVHNLPKYPSGGDNPGDSTDAESRPDDIVGELRREHAEELAGYSLRAETLKQGLLSCYRQYDTVKEKLDNLRLQNSPKTD